MNTTNQPAVIVDPYSTGALYAETFRQRGVPVYAVISTPVPPDVYAASYRPDDFDQVFVFTGDNLEQLLSSLSALQPRCILPGTESGVELCDLLCQSLLPEYANDANLSSARRHKYLMAQAVAAAGLAVIPQICTDSVAVVERWLEEFALRGRDLVIKPPKSAGTDGVRCIRAGEDWRPYFKALVHTKNRLGLMNDEVLVQQYVTGHEFVVDTVSIAGHHTVTDICRYHKIDNGGNMAVYNAMEWISPSAPDNTALIAYAFGVLDALGIRHGAGHVELMLTPEGIRLIEIAARPHGGGQARYNRVATGDSQLDRLARYHCDGELPTQDFQLLRHLTVTFLVAREAGIVSNTAVLDRAQALSTHYTSVINIRDGDRVEKTKDLFSNLDLGYIVLCGPDAAAVERDFQTIKQLEQQLLITEFHDLTA
ncbi:ATP-grasp domain-containing protein [Gynuella sunshinyii]|uniref:Biotin carboxylase n=1 Tax=Gynuella sunshinyii YC6258 TaxID=1445510 RepID=A0A0C5VR71_9GAMM|nr:ATP-grasp domain-containing protein [Gynuella sunshinyii]AJQ97137.1 biotin carboxylase [Gynuella sunshinyii YC6258]